MFLVYEFGNVCSTLMQDECFSLAIECRRLWLVEVLHI